MTDAVLEHVNFTASDPEKTAAMLCDLFGWKIRWQGASIHNGHTFHVGSDHSYVAIYSKGAKDAATENYSHVGGLNHIGVVVGDLDAVERRVREAGLEPHSHANYEPGRRFYFYDRDNVEFEVVSYAA